MSASSNRDQCSAAAIGHTLDRAPREPARRHRVVIVGGGFGGLYAAKALRGAPVELTLIDRRNYHLFQPLLYQVATGGLSPANIAYPLRTTLKRMANARVLMAEMTGVDVEQRRLRLAEDTLEYDTLVIATGAINSYFGQERWQAHAAALKTLEDATEMRGRVLRSFEMAEREVDPDRKRAWLTFVVIGGGPTGVELAGTLIEIARHTLAQEFRSIEPKQARVILIELAERVLGAYSPELSEQARESLGKLGVSLELGARVLDIDAEGVLLQRGETQERIAARTVLWAAGVQASPVGELLRAATGAELDRQGRVLVAPDCTIPGRTEIFVIGDLACFSHGLERPLPGVAPVAMQQGRFVANAIRRRLLDLPVGEFAYRDPGAMATIGRAAAVADFGWIQFSGFPAWLMWLFVHILFLIEFENRLLVMIQWAWNYFTWGRSARLITGDAASIERR